ncbi:transmembrane alpha-helix domain-containing protein [Metarhizium guizhouense ARSEF 977]|uniref:Transmembrane alpha-helix domain-containing protein n=1 Tax=Metarhizium guizhouense (strain ARSEF 977) TaxID=1276136 RepID=A0A0B4GR24_METGA|nr:transmembrane alpha-helix domain-containing protein [Metarhizium guizhouense ARSEF 977]
MSSTLTTGVSTTAYTPSVVTSFPRNPLTTTFSRPSDCDGIYMSGFLAMVDLSSTCLPSNFKSDAYFSPGLVCPSGYVSACHDTTGVASITTVTCCPALKNPDVTLGCLTTSTLSGSWLTLYCTWIAPPSSDSMLPVTTSENGITTTQTYGFHSPEGLNAFGIRMVYQSSDLSTKPTESTTHRSASRPSGAAATSNASQATDEPGGLSTGAKVAIGVVIPIVAIAALLGAFFWWRKRKHRHQVPPQAAGKSPTPRHAELNGTPFHELMTPPNNPVELAGSNPGNESGPGK